MRLLLTGFEPFAGSAINPSQEVVRAIEASRDELIGVELHTRILPVEAKRGPAMLLKAIDDIAPDAVLCLGESARAAAITLERVFINLADYRIADNAGATLSMQAIARGGPAAYFSTLPLASLYAAVKRAQVPVEYSLSAGAFLCNHVAYAMLHQLRRRKAVAAGFVHLPRLPEQIRNEHDRPSMNLGEMVRALRAMIGALAAGPGGGPRSVRPRGKGER